MRLLIIDDSKAFISALRYALNEFFDWEMESFTDPVEALTRSSQADFDLVIVGAMKPEMDGVDIIRSLRDQGRYIDVPIVLITSAAQQTMRPAALRAGATEFLSKPSDVTELQARLTNLLGLRRTKAELTQRARDLEATRRAAATQDLIKERETIWCLAQAMASRDGNTGDHVQRVASIAELIAIGLGLEMDISQDICIAAPLHDIGKIGIPDAIVQKPGKLTAEEVLKMREHVTIGVRILQNSSARLARVATKIIAGHHERWDGTGYPLGLSGDSIPIEARVVAVADVFDALCSERPYKAAWPIERAYDEIIACGGTHFDPACVAAFRRKWPSIKALFNNPAVTGRDAGCCFEREFTSTPAGSRPAPLAACPSAGQQISGTKR